MVDGAVASQRFSRRWSSSTSGPRAPRASVSFVSMVVACRDRVGGVAVFVGLAVAVGGTLVAIFGTSRLVAVGGGVVGVGGANGCVVAVGRGAGGARVADG